MRSRHLIDVLARPGAVQAWYYGVTGAWALLAYRSFEAVTGPKREPWLVKTVSLLMLAIAGALASDPAGRTAAVRRLGIGSAIAFAAADTWYAGVRRRISPIYLLDALAEFGIAMLWLASAAIRAKRDTRPVP
jgi:hypothetical protein